MVSVEAVSLIYLYEFILNIPLGLGLLLPEAIYKRNAILAYKIETPISKEEFCLIASFLDASSTFEVQS